MGYLKYLTLTTEKLDNQNFNSVWAVVDQNKILISSQKNEKINEIPLIKY